MSSKPDPRDEALKSFNAKADAFLCDVLEDATARNFCHACAIHYVARLLIAACEVVDHNSELLTDELPRTAFDDAPGHA